MTFYVVEATPEIRSFFERDPEWPCVHGHEECSFRPGGPCWQIECTCETSGQCAACTPSRKEITDVA